MITKRGIAGSLILTQFDRGVFNDIMDKAEYAAKIHDIKSGGRSFVDETNEFGLRLRKPSYPDQIPPFTITLTAANEYGHMSRAQFFGVELLNMGSGMSIDDIISEVQMTFVCRDFLDFVPVSDSSTFQNSKTFTAVARTAMTTEELSDRIGLNLGA